MQYFFIGLNRLTDGRPVAILVDSIESFEPYESGKAGCRIFHRSGCTTEVRQSYMEIWNTLENESKRF